MADIIFVPELTAQFLTSQIQQDKAAQLLNAAANQTALAAIGQRKRPLADGGGASGPSQPSLSSDGSGSAASLFAPLVSGDPLLPDIS